MSGIYSLENTTLTIGGYSVSSGLEDASDSIAFAPNGDDGDITYGTNGEGVFVHTCNKGGVITIKCLQHTETNQILNDLRNDQNNFSQNFSGVPVYFKDLANGDEIFATNCFFTTPPTITRGNAHNTMTWTLKAIKMTMNLKEGLFK